MCDLFYEDDLEAHKAVVKAREQVTMLKRMDDAHKLLTLLLAAADGITQNELMMTHNFAPSLIYRCIESKLIDVWVQTIDARTVFRFYASDTGRAFLQQGVTS